MFSLVGGTGASGSRKIIQVKRLFVEAVRVLAEAMEVIVEG